MLSLFQRRSLLVLVPVASAVGFGFIGCGSGEEPRADGDLVAVSTLRLAFPSQAARVLELGEPLVESEGVFVRAPEAARPKQSLAVKLPKKGSHPVVLRAPSGLEVRLRQDVEGEGKLVGRTVAYERAGGTAYWTVGTRGAEAFLQLAGASHDAPVASFQVEGGTLRQTGDLVEVLDEAGIAHFRMQTPVALGPGEREIPVRVEVRDGNIHFYVDADEEGALLLTPVWTGTGSMTTPRVEHTVTRLSNGKVFVAGGRSGASGTTALGSAEIFDPETETFTLVVPTSGSLSPRFAHTASLLQDGTGRVLLTGGYPNANSAALTTTQIYSPSANVWTTAGALGAARGSHGAVALSNGGVMVAGGMSGNAGASIRITSVEIFDGQSWSTTSTSLGSARRNLSLSQLADGSVLVVGGDSSSSPPSRAVDRYNPTTGQRVAYDASALKAGRSAHAAVKLLNGRVLVTNGAIAGTSSGYGEVFDLGTNAWSSTGAMKGDRTGAPAVLLGDKVLVAGGGASAAAALATAELYDPATNTWSDAPSLNAARRFAGAVTLDDGRVLIVGGEGPSGVLSSAELYTGEEEDLCANVVCDAESQCRLAGVCDPADGTCSYTDKADGTICDDGDPTTVDDVCTSGVCAGVNICVTVKCGGETECKEAGVCNPSDGTCSYADKADGTICDDGNPATVNDVCNAGVCAGVDLCANVTCDGATECKQAGVCNPLDGTCSYANKADGTICDDGNAATVNDVCTAGVCAGVDLCANVTCDGATECTQAGVCNPADGTCSYANKADGTVCDDGNAATVNDVCTAGVCAGVDLCANVTCDGATECKQAGVCNPADGTCSYANKADGTICDDGNPATVNDVCTSGVCAGVDLCANVICNGETECQEAGVCNPLDGSCFYADKADGTACSGGTCSAGECVDESPDGGVEDPDAGPIEDAGSDAEDPADAGEDDDAGLDGGEDAGEDASTDAGDEDAGDAGDEDAGETDGGDADGGETDGGDAGDVTDGGDAGDDQDGGLGDAGGDASSGDAGKGDSGDGDEPGTDELGESVDAGGGCGCRTTGGPANQGGVLAALALAGAVVARRRRG